MPAWAVILAAGSGTRIGEATAGLPKQFLDWSGRPLYWHSAMTFSKSACVEGIVFVFPEITLEREQERIAKLALSDSFGLQWLATAGGPRRQDSCRNGVGMIPMHVQQLLVHDAARPFMKAALARRVCSAVSAAAPCVVPAMPVTDTIKLVNCENLVEKTLPRAQLVACQTPQGFWAPALRRALDRIGDVDVTDEASLMEVLGYPVDIVPGDVGNVKITNPEDLKLLGDASGQLLPCNGFGYDVHRFGVGRPLIVGGVRIPGSYEVVAHSDGDVLLHALMDAILGMASLGDIGCHFPDNDVQFEGISSAVLLDRVMEMAMRAKVRLCHADLTVVAQRPRFAPHAGEIRRNVARLLALSENCVNFKATTEEKLGFTGNGDGIKAYALASGLKACK